MQVWTQSEVNFLRKNYKKLKYSEVSKKLKRTDSSIWGKCFQLKLNKGYHNLWSTQKVITTLKEISKYLGHSPSAREINISLLRACERYFGSLNKAKKAAKLTIKTNLNFLPKDSYKPSRDLAYVTGVILGDGSIRVQISKQRTTYVIIFATIDKNFMEKFVNDFYAWSHYKPRVTMIKSGYKKFPSGKFYNYKKVFYTQIPFKEACLFLKKFKEFPLYCLEFFPKKYLGWLAKGLWDSEGSITTGNKKYLRIVFTNYDENIITLFRKILGEFSIPNSLQKCRKEYSVVEILTREGKIKFIRLINGITIKRKITYAIISNLKETSVQL